MRKIIIKHWLYGNLVFIGIWSMIYYANVLTSNGKEEISYYTFLWIITLLSMTYTTVFTALDYVLIFKKRYKDFSRKDLK